MPTHRPTNSHRHHSRTGVGAVAAVEKFNVGARENVSARALKMLDKSIRNLKLGAASARIDLSTFVAS
jgi:hypothetical protein